MSSNVMPFKRESQGPPQAPPEQTVKVSFIGTTSQENFFSILNVGVDPSGTFLVLSKQKSSTFLKLSEIDRVDIEIQKVDLVG